MNIQTPHVITREIARRVLETIDAGLIGGMGEPIPGQMCVEAAVCFALGMEHSDDPKCVAPSLRALKISLNDIDWPNEQARAKGLRRLGLIQLGSLGTVNEKIFIEKVVLWIANNYLKEYFRTYPSDTKDLRKFSARFNKKIIKAQKLLTILEEIDNFSEEHWGWTDDVVDSLRSALSSVENIPNHCDCDNAGERVSDTIKALYMDTNSTKAGVKILNDYAEAVVQILVKLKAPGRQWLKLTNAHT